MDFLPETGCTERLVYTAAAGEFNEVHVGGLSLQVPNPIPGPFCDAPVDLVGVSEQFHRLRAGPGCLQFTTRSAACANLPLPANPDIRDTRFLLGDADDLLTISPGSLPGGTIDAGRDRHPGRGAGRG